ncbi:MAG: hypothetical protein J6J79_07905 [Lachnospiraceae bacterium]|nr:hypothetical protein [Lachnospiraceae bacterium]
MGTYDNVNDLKRAFAKEIKKEEEIAIENEQSLLKAITIYICRQKGVSPLQGYNPDEVIAFLDKPIAEIKECIGGDLAALPDDKFENLRYTLSKKVKKISKMTIW